MNYTLVLNSGSRILSAGDVLPLRFCYGTCHGGVSVGPGMTMSGDQESKEGVPDWYRVILRVVPHGKFPFGPWIKKTIEFLVSAPRPEPVRNSRRSREELRVLVNIISMDRQAWLGYPKAWLESIEEAITCCTSTDVPQAGPPSRFPPLQQRHSFTVPGHLQ